MDIARHLLHIRFAYADPAFSPDGAHVAYVHDGSGQMNLWRQPAAGGQATRLTALQDAGVRFVTWTALGFLIGVGRTDERCRLCHVPQTGGRPRDLLGGEELHVRLGPVHADGERIAVADDRSGLRLLRVGGAIRTLLDEPCVPGPWHPDGRRLAVVMVGRDGEIVLLDGETGERTGVPTPNGSCLPVGFDGGGRHLYALTSAWPTRATRMPGGAGAAPPRGRRTGGRSRPGSRPRR